MVEWEYLSLISLFIHPDGLSESQVRLSQGMLNTPDSSAAMIMMVIK